MEVYVGEARIPRKNVRRLLQAIGGYVGLYISALDEEGAGIEEEIKKLEEGKVYELTSVEVSGIVKVKSIKREKREESGRKIYIFNIELQIIA